MVHSGKKEGEEGGSEREIVMAMQAQRWKPPLHNFNLHFLKWGSQRHLRCKKVTDYKAAKENGSRNGISSTNRHRFNRLSSSKSDTGGFKDNEEVQEQQEELEEREEQSRSQSPAAAAMAVVAETELDARPWNLRKRRAACKTLVGGENSVIGKGLFRIEERKGSNYSPLRGEGTKSPRLRAEKREEKGRPKFSVALSRKEIDEDFMEIVGHRSARRPKKRSKAVQKQLDTLFPGLWLTEVSVDTYKVPDLPEKR